MGPGYSLSVRPFFGYLYLFQHLATPGQLIGLFLHPFPGTLRTYGQGLYLSPETLLQDGTVYAMDKIFKSLDISWSNAPKLFTNPGNPTFVQAFILDKSLTNIVRRPTLPMDKVSTPQN